MKDHPVAIERARRLRRNITPAEYKLWFYLKNRLLAGHKFVRQQPIGPYIVDFASRSHKLIIELDGSQHAESLSDERRDRFLAWLGYRVLRFWNHEVMSNLGGVCETILAAIEEAAPHPPSAKASLRLGDLSPRAGRGWF